MVGSKVSPEQWKVRQGNVELCYINYNLQPREIIRRGLRLPHCYLSAPVQTVLVIAIALRLGLMALAHSTLGFRAANRRSSNRH